MRMSLRAYNIALLKIVKICFSICIALTISYLTSAAALIFRRIYFSIFHPTDVIHVAK